jgi:hypothetical protein
MSMSISSIYGAQAAGARVGPELNPAPDATNIGAQRPTGGNQPAMSWIALLGALVALRVLQEMAE